MADLKMSSSKLLNYFQNEAYRDQWVMISTPNTDNKDLANRKLVGFYLGGDFSENVSLNSDSSALEGLGGASRLLGGKIGQAIGKVEDVTDSMSKAVPDYIVYRGVSNTTKTVQMLVLPDIKGNPDMGGIIDYLNKLTKPKPYSSLGKSINPILYQSYLPELNKVNALKNTFDETIDKVKSMFSERKLLEDEWSDQYCHIHIGDNIHYTGMVLMDIDITFDNLRDEHGQFWYATVSFGFAPYRIPNAEIATKFITNKNSWSVK